jgi:hypothetical protein
MPGGMDSRSPSVAGRRDRASAAAAGPAPNGRVAPAVGPAASLQRIGKLPKLNGCFVPFCHVLGQRIDFRRNIPKKIKEERSAIEQMFDIDQRDRQTTLFKQLSTTAERLFTISLKSYEQQVVFGRNATEQRSVGGAGGVFIHGLTKDDTDFQTPARTTNDASAPCDALTRRRHESAHVSEQTNADQVA